MISVAIIGLGNVGTHLYHALNSADGIAVMQLNSRIVPDSLDADIAIIAVSDSAISAVSKKINAPLVVHTSGSVDMSELQNKGRKGVFYPLQTFTKGTVVSFQNIPLCLEAEEEQDLTMLEALASSISDQSFRISSAQRQRIHVSAVFVNNFVNHLYTMAHSICAEHNVPFEILQPLIQETTNKIKHISPIKAQTGPAKRNDIQTIQKHLHLLNEHQQEIYRKLTESIQTYGKKL